MYRLRFALCAIALAPTVALAQSARIPSPSEHLGFQVGARFQLSQMIGLDAQYRRVSEFASETQGGDLERNQVLVGITLF